MPIDREVPLEVRKAIVEAKLADVGTVQETPDGWRYYDVDQPQETLEWAVREGFILHGTTRRIDGDFIPHQAYDLAKSSGNRKAVYLTKNPLVAEFAGFTGGLDVAGRENDTRLEIDDETGEFSYPGEQRFRVGDPDRMAREGFIYIFDKSQADEEIEGEFLAYDRIHPLAVIRFDRATFPYPIDRIEPGNHDPKPPSPE